jgi:DNA-binding transcriptional MerR regulator
MSARPSNNDTEPITLKELAAVVDELPSTLDYWTKLGLLVSARRKGNARVYDPEVNVERIRRIRQRKDSGLNLAAIRREFDERG